MVARVLGRYLLLMRELQSTYRQDFIDKPPGLRHHLFVPVAQWAQDELGNTVRNVAPDHL